MKAAGIVGCLMCVLLSFANGTLSVLTRMMQSINVSVMMVYIALTSIVILLSGLMIENAITGGPLRILNYTKE